MDKLISSKLVHPLCVKAVLIMASNNCFEMEIKSVWIQRTESFIFTSLLPERGKPQNFFSLQLEKL